MLLELRHMRMILGHNRDSETMLRASKALEAIRNYDEVVGLQNLRSFLVKLMIHGEDIDVKAICVRTALLTVVGF